MLAADTRTVYFAHDRINCPGFRCIVRRERLVLLSYLVLCAVLVDRRSVGWKSLPFKVSAFQVSESIFLIVGSELNSYDRWACLASYLKLLGNTVSRNRVRKHRRMNERIVKDSCMFDFRLKITRFLSGIYARWFGTYFRDFQREENGSRLYGNSRDIKFYQKKSSFTLSSSSLVAFNISDFLKHKV